MLEILFEVHLILIYGLSFPFPEPVKEPTPPPAPPPPKEPTPSPPPEPEQEALEEDNEAELPGMSRAMDDSKLREKRKKAMQMYNNLNKKVSQRNYLRYRLEHSHSEGFERADR